jgi:hypothetical protein
VKIDVDLRSCFDHGPVEFAARFSAAIVDAKSAARAVSRQVAVTFNKAQKWGSPNRAVRTTSCHSNAIQFEFADRIPHNQADKRPKASKKCFPGLNELQTSGEV